MANQRDRERDTEKTFEAVKGEGDHEADARYRDETERFIAEGDVEQAAEEAKRAMADDPEELEEAEREGRSRAAEEPEPRSRR
jgi:hypothetical protein